MNKTLENILILEGGYVDNPKDKGGATNWGITEATARKHGFLNDMRDLTRSEAYAILEEDYWIKPGFKDVANLSESIAFELCDAAVNIGQHHPVLWLQRWLREKLSGYCRGRKNRPIHHGNAAILPDRTWQRR